MVKQAVMFVDGMFAGRYANVDIETPFSQGMIVVIGGHEYEVQRGPIAELIERTQEPAAGFVIRLALVKEEVGK